MRNKQALFGTDHLQDWDVKQLPPFVTQVVSRFEQGIPLFHLESFLPIPFEGGADSQVFFGKGNIPVTAYTNESYSWAQARSAFGSGYVPLGGTDGDVFPEGLPFGGTDRDMGVFIGDEDPPEIDLFDFPFDSFNINLSLCSYFFWPDGGSVDLDYHQDNWNSVSLSVVEDIKAWSRRLSPDGSSGRSYSWVHARVESGLRMRDGEFSRGISEACFFTCGVHVSLED
jgi:hypothetical protein